MNHIYVKGISLILNINVKGRKKTADETYRMSKQTRSFESKNWGI